MVVCNRCGSVKEESELRKYHECHGYTEFGMIEEEMVDYECDCGGVYEEAKQCAICGEWFADYDRTKVCPDCMSEEMTFETALEIGEENKTKVYVNEFVQFVLTPEEINQILLEHIKSNRDKYENKVASYCKSDVLYLADWIKEKRH